MKISKKILITALISILCVAMMIGAVSAHNFNDVTRYEEAIDLLSSLEVIKGYSETRFGPDDEVTRWQMALLITKLVTGNVDTPTWEAKDNTSTFTDVKSNHYFGSIAYAHKNGIIIGRSDEVFAPEDSITFQDGLTMVVRALGYPSDTLNKGYPESYIDKGKELGLLTGIQNLGYTANMTRGHTAQLLYNALFAETYSGTPLSESSFEIIERTIVLVATENMKINANVSYAKTGSLIFSEMDDYGRLKDSFTIDASIFNLRTPNEYLGVAYNLIANEDFSIILDLTQISKFLTETKTGNLKVDSNNRTISISDGTYEPVSGFRSYKLEKDKAPTGTKEIIVYGMNDVYSTQGTAIMTKDIAGTTAYYKMTAFDDNNDGFIDRALYFPYSFGQYVIESGNKVSIASNELTSAITYTGVTVKNEDYVIYSYNPQSKTLDIMKVLEIKEGTITSTAYTSSQGTVKIGEDTFNIGREDLNGVTQKSNLEKDLIDVASGNLNNRKIKYIYEFVSNAGYIYWYELGEAETVNSETFGTNIGVITNTPTFTYTYGTLNVEINNNFSLSVVLVDGYSISTYNQPLNKGDIVKYDVYQTTGNVVTYKIEKLNSTATYNTKNAVSKFNVSNGYLNIIENGNTTKRYPLSSDTRIYVVDNNMNINIYTSSNFNETQYETYRSVFVSYNPYVANSVNAIYIRPFDSSSVIGTGEFNSVVYISKSSIDNPTTTTNSRIYSAIDLMTGTTKNVTLMFSSTYGGTTFLSTSGYYRIYNDIIANIHPISEAAITSSTTGVLTNVTVTKFDNILNTSNYIIRADNKSFSVNISDIKFYVYESSFTSNSITQYGVDSSTFDTFVSNVNSEYITQRADIIFNNYLIEGTYYGSIAIIARP